MRAIDVDISNKTATMGHECPFCHESFFYTFGLWPALKDFKVAYDEVRAHTKECTKEVFILSEGLMERVLDL